MCKNMKVLTDKINVGVVWRNVGIDRRNMGIIYNCNSLDIFL